MTGRAVLLNLMGYLLPEILTEQLYRGQLLGAQNLPIDVIPGYLDFFLHTSFQRIELPYGFFFLHVLVETVNDLEPYIEDDPVSQVIHQFSR
ncbi:MAG: hypothetical protein RQ801_03340 [Spirochaetaceae bacterium]|nr:hypothetical protein [Spirochaetaceae bacterium]MDT8297311.1 hypothetical protein [Spirochaetaceae bacterium]